MYVTTITILSNLKHWYTPTCTYTLLIPYTCPTYTPPIGYTLPSITISDNSLQTVAKLCKHAITVVNTDEEIFSSVLFAHFRNLLLNYRYEVAATGNTRVFLSARRTISVYVLYRV